jgi:hypothetical protein
MTFDRNERYHECNTTTTATVQQSAIYATDISNNKWIQSTDAIEQLCIQLLAIYANYS